MFRFVILNLDSKCLTLSSDASAEHIRLQRALVEEINFAERIENHVKDFDGAIEFLLVDGVTNEFVPRPNRVPSTKDTILEWIDVIVEDLKEEPKEDRYEQFR